MTDDVKRDLAADLADYERGREALDDPSLARWDANTRIWETARSIATAQFCAVSRRAIDAEAEVRRLQAIIEGMAKRIAGQSELLSRRAEA